MKSSILAVLPAALVVGTAIGGLSLPSGDVHAAVLTAPHIQDLAGSAVIQSQTTGPVDSQFASLETTYNAPLTSMYSWHGFLRQNGRDITVSLPSNSDVTSVSIQLEQDATSGIYYPSHVDFEALYNGQWYNVGSRASVVPLTDRRLTTQTYTLHLNGLRATRIRIHFPVGVWVFARRLEVMGQPDSSLGPAMPSGATPVSTQPASPASSYGGNQGIRNMLIVYTGANGSAGTWTPSDFAPMVSYIPQNAQASALMFDTMLFTPYPSMADTQAAWQSYLNDLFMRGQQLDALNTAVGLSDQTLGTPYRKEKVVLTIPYPSFGDGNWGTVNGQSISFDPTATDAAALSAREAALNWYIQTLLSDWNAQGYQNLQLVGLYWQQEDVNYNSPGEVALIRNTANLVHQNGHSFFWIPFYDASGLTDWQQFGFDAAWLQPNYAEQGSAANISRVQNAGIYAKESGLGVELELAGDPTAAQTQSLYAQTINQLETDGIGQSVSHAYYAGSKGLITAANSSDPSTRSVYDETYNFLIHP